MFQEEDLAELQSNADAIDKFQTYEDYLDDQISAEDMFYLEVSPSLGGRWTGSLVCSSRAASFFSTERERARSLALPTPHTPHPTPILTHFSHRLSSRAHTPTRAHAAHTATHTHARSLERRTRIWPGSSSRGSILWWGSIARAAVQCEFMRLRQL